MDEAGTRIQVRPALPDELERLKEVRLRALLDSPGAFGSRYDDEADRDPASWLPWVAEGATFVGEDGEDWHGLVAVFSEQDDPSACHIISMWVSPSRRRAGLGRDLIDAAVRWAIDRGADKVTLGVVEDNDSAVRLYTNAGFRPNGSREPHRSNPSKTIVFMELSLGDTTKSQ